MIEKLQVTKLETGGYHGNRVYVELSDPSYSTVSRLSSDLRVTFVAALTDDYRMGEQITVTIERDWEKPERDHGPLPMREVIDGIHRYKPGTPLPEAAWAHEEPPR